MRFCSFEELRQQFTQRTREIVQVMLGRRTTHEVSCGEELIAFVDANYRNPDLSLKMLADHFDMSANYVSRVFRDIVGKGFSEYVSEHRMRYVKDKLGSSLEPIKDIILSAGYRDVPNYVRKFKQAVGVTPGEYRKNILQTEED